MKIALDLDGTLADIIGLWLTEYNKRSRKRLDYHNITKWDFWMNLGYTPTRFFKELSNCWKRWRSIKPIEEEVSYAVDQLHKFGKVDIVTARDPESSIYAKEWLKYHNIKYDQFVLVARGSDKAYLNYDIFIDDSPINAKKISAFDKMILLYNQPWNKDVKESSNIVRIRQLSDALDFIQVIA